VPFGFSQTQLSLIIVVIVVIYHFTLFLDIPGIIIILSIV
jgi:hypothetical protein